MTASSLNAIIHLAGFGAGIVLYGLLAVMARPSAQRGGERLSFATAVLGLLWNSGALVMFSLRDLGAVSAPGWLAFVAYAALGFLPAVAVHAAAESQALATGKVPVVAGYGISVLAAGWQFWAALQGAEVPVRAAMLFLTIGNTALVIALLWMSRQRSWGRQASSVALAIFAVMALHLSTHADASEGWVSALLGHHASLPLALAILYQDYRFALADVFIKRALALLAVATIAGVLLGAVVLPLLAATTSDGSERLLAIVLVLALWVVTALLTPVLISRIDRFVDRALLRRRAPQDVLAELSQRLRDLECAPEVLDVGTRAIADALAAQDATWREDVAIDLDARVDVVLEERGTRAEVVVPVQDGPGYVIRVARPAGGRRILSEDRALLVAIAAQLGRRLDAQRAADERTARDIREESLRRLTSEAELEALRAQLHPHFLFNALNTLGHLMQASPERARSTLYRLTSLLRAVLQRSDERHTRLGDELALVEDYLAIERERFEERLAVMIDVPAALRDARVPPLSLQTLVENAIKHGISPLARGGSLHVTAALEDGALVLTVRDSGRGTDSATDEVPSRGGVGLSNLARRLERLYEDQATLHFVSAPNVGTTVIVRVPVSVVGRPALRAAS